MNYEEEIEFLKNLPEEIRKVFKIGKEMAASELAIKLSNKLPNSVWPILKEVVDDYLKEIESGERRNSIIK